MSSPDASGTGSAHTNGDPAPPHSSAHADLYRVLFETAADAQVILDGERIVDCNLAAARLVGVPSREAFLELTLADMFPEYQSDGQPSLPTAIELIEESLRRGSVIFEWTLRCVDGRLITIENRLTALPVGDRKLVHVMARDISERRRTEAALRDSEQRSAALFETLGMGMAICDMSGRLTEVNGRLCIMLGYPPETLRGKTADELTHPDDRHRLADLMQQVADGRRDSFQIEKRCLRGNGEPIWCDVFVRGFADADGAPDAFICAAIDITERKAAEQAAAERQQRLRSIFTAAPVGIGVVVDRVLMEVNDRMCELVGYSRDELVGQSARMLYPSQEAYDRVGREKYGQIAAQGTGSVETQFRRKDGAIIDVILSSTPLDRKDLSAGVTFTVMDITERKQAEQALRNSEARFRSLLETAPVSILIASDGQYLYANPYAARLLGYDDPRDLVGVAFLDTIAPPFHGSIRRRAQELSSGDARRHPTMEMELVRRDGTATWSESTSVSIEWEGRMAALIVGRDITDRKQAEEALRVSEREKSLILGATSEMFAYYDTDLNVLWANKAAGDSVGESLEALVGRHCYAIWHGRNEPCEDCPVLKAKATGRAQEGEVVSPDGRVWLLRGYPIFDDAGQVVNLVEFGQDITDRKQAERDRQRLEDQLRHAQKMEAIGLLAGGVAHDFNNLLQAIWGFTDLAAESLPPNAPAVADLANIRLAAERGRSLVRQLLTFSRRDAGRLTRVDLNGLIRASLTMLRRVLSEDVELEFVPGDDLPPITADPTQIEQIIVNLCVNARDAMPDGGRLVVETRRGDPSRCRLEEGRPIAPDACLELSVSDTGAGMPPEVRRRVFEPFFSTKDVGKGTGLGLSTVYGIVQQHQGTIHIDSEVGRGTTVRICLPGAGPDDLPVEAALEAMASVVTSPAGAGATILLAEDDELVRKLAVKVLTGAGYRVLVAENGAEAIAIFRRHHAEIHLVLLDMIMPGASGRVVDEIIRELRPDVPVLFASGYGFAEHSARDHSGPTRPLLNKPFGADELLAAIGEALGGR